MSHALRVETRCLAQKVASQTRMQRSPPSGEYFTFFQVYREMSPEGDMRVSLEEFNKALPLLKEWGVEITPENAETEFKTIDKASLGRV